jgi:hypothetical protein
VEPKSRDGPAISEERLASDWLGRLGRSGFEALVNNVVKRSVDEVVREKVEPRFVSLDNRLSSIENRLAAVETRLDISDRIAKLEVEVASLKRGRQG